MDKGVKWLFASVNPGRDPRGSAPPVSLYWKAEPSQAEVDNAWLPSDPRVKLPSGSRVPGSGSCQYLSVARAWNASRGERKMSSPRDLSPAPLCRSSEAATPPYAVEGLPQSPRAFQGQSVSSRVHRASRLRPPCAYLSRAGGVVVRVPKVLPSPRRAPQSRD